MNATLISKPNLKYETSATDTIIQMKINGSITHDKKNPILPKTVVPLTYNESVEQSYFFGKSRIYVSQYTLFGYF